MLCAIAALNTGLVSKQGVIHHQLYRHQVSAFLKMHGFINHQGYVASTFRPPTSDDEALDTEFLYRLATHEEEAQTLILLAHLPNVEKLSINFLAARF
jgi:hypothetical protein